MKMVRGRVVGWRSERFWSDRASAAAQASRDVTLCRYRGKRLTYEKLRAVRDSGALHLRGLRSRDGGWSRFASRVLPGDVFEKVAAGWRIPRRRVACSGGGCAGSWVLTSWNRTWWSSPRASAANRTLCARRTKLQLEGSFAVVWDHLSRLFAGGSATGFAVGRVGRIIPRHGEGFQAFWAQADGPTSRWTATYAG